MRTLPVLTLLACTAALAAQKVPMPDKSGRILQLFDLRQGQAPGEDDAAPAPNKEQFAPTVTFVRSFVRPPLQAGDDVTLLADRWLAVLGSPEQIASAENLLAVAASRSNELLMTTIHICEMSPAIFQANVAPLLPAFKPGEVSQTVLERKTAEDLLAALQNAECSLLIAPRVATQPLRSATMSVGNQISYIKDFTLTPVDGKVIADPEVAIIWDGIQLELMASFLRPAGNGAVPNLEALPLLAAKDRVGVQCSLLLQNVAQPIAEFTTNLGSGTPISIQLPRTTGVKLQQTAELQLGSSVLIAAPKTDGTWMTALVEITGMDGGAQQDAKKRLR